MISTHGHNPFFTAQQPSRFQPMVAIVALAPTPAEPFAAGADTAPMGGPLFHPMAFQMMQAMAQAQMMSSIFNALLGLGIAAAQLDAHKTAARSTAAPEARTPSAVMYGTGTIVGTTAVEQLASAPTASGAGAGMPVMPMGLVSDEGTFRSVLQNRFGMSFEEVRTRYATAKGYSANDPLLANVKPSHLYLQMQVESRFGNLGKLVGYGNVNDLSSPAAQVLGQVGAAYEHILHGRDGAAGQPEMSASLARTQAHLLLNSGLNSTSRTQVYEMHKAQEAFDQARALSSPLLGGAGKAAPALESGWKPMPLAFMA